MLLPILAFSVSSPMCLTRADGMRASSELSSIVKPWQTQWGDCKFSFDDGSKLETADGVRLDERAPFGSITKTFTALLALKLIELNKLSLNDRLAEFHLRIPGEADITVEQLLTHTSGLPDYFYGVDPASHPTKDEILSMIRSAAKHSHSTKKYTYSNANYWLLGEICADRTGLSLPESYRKYICSPLHIGPSFERLPQFDPEWYGGAGELSGTLSDLLNFGSAIGIADRRLLNAKSWSGYASEGVPMDPRAPEEKYGFGIIQAPITIYPTFSHAGTIPANGGEKEYASMLIVRKNSKYPEVCAAFKRGAWDGTSLNSLYGAFASCCAVADAKRFLSLLASTKTPSNAQFASIGPVDSAIQKVLRTANPVFGRLGSLRQVEVESQLVTGTSVKLKVLAHGTEGSVDLNIEFGSKGTLALLNGN